MPTDQQCDCGGRYKPDREWMCWTCDKCGEKMRDISQDDQPARLTKEPDELRGMQLEWIPAVPHISSVKFHFKDFSEVEPDGREDRQSNRNRTGTSSDQLETGRSTQAVTSGVEPDAREGAVDERD